MTPIQKITDPMRIVRTLGPHPSQMIVKAVENSLSVGGSWITSVKQVMEDNDRNWIPGNGDILDQDVMVIVLRTLRREF